MSTWVNFTSFVYNSATKPTDFLVGYIGSNEQKYPVYALKNGLSAGEFPVESLYVRCDANIDGNVTIKGNLTALGSSSVFETIVSITSALSVVNTGTGPALTVKQTGTEPIALFLDDDNNTLRIDDNFKVSFFNSRATNSYSIAENYNTLASGLASHAEGTSTEASGQSSHAEGQNSKASGYISHTEGYGTSATNSFTHAEGNSTKASGQVSHAEGSGTKAYGDGSHAEGIGTTASGDVSHAEGSGTIAVGYVSHAAGIDTLASGEASHAEGSGTTASSDYSHAEGYRTKTGYPRPFQSYNSPTRVFTFNPGTSANFNFVTPGTILRGYEEDEIDSEFVITVLDRSTLNGNITAAADPIGANSTSGWLVDNGGIFSHAEGVGTIASGQYSHAEGSGTKAYGEGSHAEGIGTTAYEGGSHAEGLYTQASGQYSHAEGNLTKAYGGYSHAEGNESIAYGINSHAENQTTLAYGQASHAQGGQTLAYGGYSHAEGFEAKAMGAFSHAAGYYAAAANDRSWVWKGSTDTATMSTTRTGQFMVSASGGLFLNNAVGINTDNNNNALTVNGTISGNSSLVVDTLTGRNISLIHQPANDGVNPYIQLGELTTGSTIASSFSGFRFEYSENTNSLNLSSIMRTTVKNIFNIDSALPSISFFSSKATGMDAQATGYDTLAKGAQSNAEGFQAVAHGQGSHAEGVFTNAAAAYSHAEGYNTCVGYPRSFSTYTASTRIFTFATTISSFFNAIVPGDRIKGVTTLLGSPFTITVADRSTITGDITATTDPIGADTTVGQFFIGSLNESGHAEGKATIAAGSYSHAEGYYTIALGNASHAEGSITNASGLNSHAEGSNTTALGNNSHAEGNYTTALGDNSHAAGNYANARYDRSWIWNASTSSNVISTTRAEQFMVSAGGGLFLNNTVGINTDSTANALTVVGNISATGSLICNNLSSRNINLIHQPANDGTNPYITIGEYTSGSALLSAFSGFKLEYDENLNTLNLSAIFGTITTNIINISSNGDIGINNTTVRGNLSASGNLNANTASLRDTTILGALSVRSPNYNTLLQLSGISGVAVDPLYSSINGRLGVNTVPLTSYGVHIRGGNLRVDGVDYSNFANITSFDTDGQSLFDLRSAAVGSNYSLSIAESGLGNFMKFFGGRTGDAQPFIVVRSGTPLRFASFNSYYDGTSFSEKARIGGNGNLSVGLATDGGEKITVLGNISASGNIIGNTLTARNIALVHQPANDGTNPYITIGEYTPGSALLSAFSGFKAEYNENTNTLGFSSILGTTVTSLLNVDPYTSITPYTVTLTPFTSGGTGDFVSNVGGTIFYPPALSGVLPGNELASRLLNNRGSIDGLLMFANGGTTNAKQYVLEFAKDAAFSSQNTPIYKRASGEITASISRPINGIFANGRIILPNANATQPVGTNGSLIDYTYTTGEPIYYRIGFSYPATFETMGLSAGYFRINP